MTDLHKKAMSLALESCSLNDPIFDRPLERSMSLFRKKRRWWYVGVITCPKGHTAFNLWPDDGDASKAPCPQCGALASLEPIHEHQRLLDKGNWTDEDYDL